MSVNPASPFFITANIDRYRAVVPVDIQSQDPNAPDVVSGKAQVVIIGGTLNGSNNIVPLVGGGGSATSLADSLVVDATGVYWILQDQGGGTFVYYKLSTLAVGTPTAPVVPAATSTGLQIVDQTYTCTAAGTGYAIGDIVEHIIVLNITTNPPTISQSSWINITQGTVLAGAPTAANINPIDDNVNASIADGADVTQGSKADAAYAGGGGNATVVAALKGCYNLLAAPIPAGANVIGSVNINGALPAFAATPTFNIGTAPTIAVTGTFWQTTQPISAASLPLPTGAVPAVAQGSTTSGQSGDLVMGAVTTLPPSYTTGQTSPLSVNTGGGLRADITYVAGQNVSSAAPNGSGNYALGQFQTTAISNVDQNATAFAGAGSVLGTIVASTKGGGAVISAEINVSALTLGTATSVFAILQESPDGTNFTDIWVSDPITATGNYRVPAIQVAGRRRWRFFSVGGTSTTVTATITTSELPSGYPLIRQGRDAYAATNPFATMYNGAAMAASSFSLTTLNSVTSPMYVEGAKQITAYLQVNGSVTWTTQPVVTVQYSIDGVYWFGSASLGSLNTGGYGITITGAYKFVRLIVTTAGVVNTGSPTISNIGVNAVN